MRRILYYSLLCLLWVSVNSCQDDEASQPPTPSFTVDKTSGLYQTTEFTFTVDQVGSNAVSLLPYGADHVNDAGILIPASSFVNGKASVKFTYGKVGTFSAVVVANNHTGDGLSVKNAVSSPTPITITSDQTSISDFTFDKATKTVIDAAAHTIAVTMAYTLDHLTALKAKYTASDFSTVTVGGVAQKSGDTPNNFNTPVTFNVKSQDGLKSTDWIVTVTETPVETDNTVKSSTGTIAKKGKAAGRVLPGAVNNVAREIVIYDTLGIDVNDYDSVALAVNVNGKFAYARFADKTKLSGKDTVDLTDDLAVTVVPQDSTVTGPVDYDIFIAEAPQLNVSFPVLNPTVSGSNNQDFAVAMNVLTGTTVSAIVTDFTFDVPAGAVIGTVKADGVVKTSGMAIDYSKPVKFEVLVTQGTLIYTVTYTITVTVLK